MSQPDAPQAPQEQDLGVVEAAFYTLVLAALTAWLAQVSAAVAASGPLGVYATVAFWSAQVDRLIRWLEGADADVRSDPLFHQHLNQVSVMLNSLPAQLVTRIDRILRDGGTRADQEARIVALLDPRGEWPARARRIAVTEVNGAASAAQMARLIREQQATGVSLVKRWRSLRDAKVRTDHDEADGQTRPIMEPFLVGGWPMMYPGDKAGPPEQVIECRCDMRKGERR